jgi:hypothetical protein
MNRNHQIYRRSSESLFYQFSISRNPLRVGIVNFIWDHHRRQLILIMESEQSFSREVTPLLKDNTLILEAPLVPTYEKPVRSHLIGRQAQDDLENGTADIGFSEIKLKPGYQYTIISSEVMDSRLFKVILGYRVLGINGNN